MPHGPSFSASPFDTLGPAERARVEQSLETLSVAEGEQVLEPGVEPTHLWVVIEGRVERHDQGALTETLHVDDVFDLRALVTGFVSSRFVAAEGTTLCRIPRALILALVAENETFGALLFAALSRGLGASEERRTRHEFHALALTRVDQAFLRAPHFVDASLDVTAVVRLFRDLETRSVLVRAGERLGIFTVTDLQRAILDGRPLDELPVGDLATYTLITVRPSAVLGDALALMIQHDVQRVIVGEPGEIQGILHGLDLFSFLSNQSYLLGLQIAEANTLEVLGGLAQDLERLVRLLHEGGSKTSSIMRLKHVLDLKLLARTWVLVAPPDLVRESCLYVMGSEGRGEQLLRTDQDNGLVFADHLAGDPRVPAAAQAFSAALRSFGFPDCPGRVMAENPEWQSCASELVRQVRRWVVTPEPDTLIRLASFLDARAVSGDPALLEAARDEAFSLAPGHDTFLHHFAQPAERIDAERSWWGRLWAPDREAPLDLKKAALFPIVHGARSLALEHGVRETSTLGRLEALSAQGHLSGELATALAESFEFFVSLKLRMALDATEGRAPSSGLEVGRLGRLDRERLKDTQAVVQRFREHLRLHFHLESG